MSESFPISQSCKGIFSGCYFYIDPKVSCQGHSLNLSDPELCHSVRQGEGVPQVLKDSDIVKLVSHCDGKVLESFDAEVCTHILSDDYSADEDGCVARLINEHGIKHFNAVQVSTDWMLTCFRGRRRLPETCKDGFTAPFCSADKYRHQFAGVVATLSRIEGEQRLELAERIIKFGGQVRGSLNAACTHVITTELRGNKVREAMRHPDIKIIHPKWVEHCLEDAKQPHTSDYDPRAAQESTAVQLSTEQMMPIDYFHPQVFQGFRFRVEDVDDPGVVKAEIERCGGVISNFECEDAEYIISDSEVQDPGPATVRTAQWIEECIRFRTLEWTPRALHWKGWHFIPFEREPISSDSQLSIAYTGYTGAQRDCLKRLIEMTGANATATMSRTNTHLLSMKSSSDKHRKAEEWGLKVVSHVWLMDSILMWSWQPLEKYQQRTGDVDLAESQFTYFGAREVQRSAVFKHPDFFPGPVLAHVPQQPAPDDGELICPESPQDEVPESQEPEDDERGVGDEDLQDEQEYEIPIRERIQRSVSPEFGASQSMDPHPESDKVQSPNKTNSGLKATKGAGGGEHPTRFTNSPAKSLSRSASSSVTASPVVSRSNRTLNYGSAGKGQKPSGSPSQSKRLQEPEIIEVEDAEGGDEGEEGLLSMSEGAAMAGAEMDIDREQDGSDGTNSPVLGTGARISNPTSSTKKRVVAETLRHEEDENVEGAQFQDSTGKARKPSEWRDQAPSSNRAAESPKQVRRRIQHFTEETAPRQVMNPGPTKRSRNSRDFNELSPDISPTGRNHGTGHTTEAMKPPESTDELQRDNMRNSPRGNVAKHKTHTGSVVKSNNTTAREMGKNDNDRRSRGSESPSESNVGSPVTRTLKRVVAQQADVEPNAASSSRPPAKRGAADSRAPPAHLPGSSAKPKSADTRHADEALPKKQVENELSSKKTPKVKKARTCGRMVLVHGRSFERAEQAQVVKRLGGSSAYLHSFDSNATHIVIKEELKRTEKFLCGCSGGRWIVKPSFLESCGRLGMWVNEAAHEWHNPGKINDTVRPDGTVRPVWYGAPRRWRNFWARNGHGPFHGKSYLVLPGCTPGNDALIQKIVEEGSGDAETLATMPRPEQVLEMVAGRDITNVIVPETCGKEVVQAFDRAGATCLADTYILDLISLKETPDPTDYVLSQGRTNSAPKRMAQSADEEPPAKRRKQQAGKRQSAHASKRGRKSGR